MPVIPSVFRTRGLLGCAFVLTGACSSDVLPLQGNTPGTAGTAGATTAGAGGASGRPSTAGRGGGAQGGTAGLGEGGGGDVPSTPDATAVSLEGSPIHTRVQRLTISQWERAVTDILRLPVPSNLSSGFTLPLRGATDFTNNEKLLFVDQPAALDFEVGAETAAALATGTIDALERIEAGTEPGAFVRTLGRRAFRRPLTPDEEARFLTVFELGETLYGEGFANGASLAIRAMLQSPKFLYRSELGAGGEPLSGFELASKLSFWLLGTTPSDALLDAAEAGELDSVDALESAASVMLDDALAVEVMRDFHTQLYQLDRYSLVVKSGELGLAPEVNTELLHASVAFFDAIFVQNAGLREILTAAEGFVGPALAPLYGLNPPAQGFEPRFLGPTRAGYFMQVPFLFLHGRDRVPDAIGRGVALASDVLCVALKPSDTEAPALPPYDPGQTNRQRVESFTAECAGSCHAHFEPLGFALEHFDGVGVERTEDSGQPVDAAGSYAFADGTREFSDGVELMHLMADGVQAHTCYAKKLSGYALQRDIVATDRALLDTLSEVSREQSLRAMVLKLVRDPAFRVRKEDVK